MAPENQQRIFGEDRGEFEKARAIDLGRGGMYHGA